jgi:hypothetical protein
MKLDSQSVQGLFAKPNAAEDGHDVFASPRVPQKSSRYFTQKP